MNIRMRKILYLPIYIVNVMLLSACGYNRNAVNVNDIIDADSILYIKCHSDSVIGNTYYSSWKRDSFFIKDNLSIKEIINLLKEHTDKSVVKHPMICDYLEFYVSEKKYIIGIWREGVSYNGEYKCDMDLIDYMDKRRTETEGIIGKGS